MNEETYYRIRAGILSRIYAHSRRTAKGTLLYPRSLAADKRELERLDREYEESV